ncbi:unnamed protein product, partial [Urochloa humidicola]
QGLLSQRCQGVWLRRPRGEKVAVLCLLECGGDRSLGESPAVPAWPPPYWIHYADSLTKSRAGRGGGCGGDRSLMFLSLSHHCQASIKEIWEQQWVFINPRDLLKLKNLFSKGAALGKNG